MASSTTKPMASTKANKVNVLIVKPASAIMANVPIKLTGIVMIGMMEARKVRKKTKMTSATKNTASAMVLNTLLIDLSIKTELSLATFMTKSAGKSCCKRGIMSRTPLDNSKGLAVACRMTPAEIDGMPFKRTRLRSSAVPSSTLATSRILMGNPFTLRMVMSPNCPGLIKSVCDVTLNSRSCDSMRPAGNSKLLRRIASSTSCEVSL